MDLEEVSQQSLRLTRIMLLVVFGVAFYWLWSDLVAVFTYLDSVVLWHKSEGTGANAVLYPISLSDVLTGLFLFGAALSLARNLPGLLEVLVLCQVREQARLQLAQALADAWQTSWQRYSGRPFRHEDAGQRALKNLALSYLALLPAGAAGALASQQYQQADNMTDRMGALTALADTHSHTRDTLFSFKVQCWALSNA